MLYGAIAGSKRGPVKQARAIFAGMGGLSVSASTYNPLSQGSANFAGTGLSLISARLIEQASISLSGVGNLLINAYIPGSQLVSAAFAGAGSLTTPDFSLPVANVASWDFNEGGGSSIADSVAANTGTLIGSPTWVGGYGGTALSFNGTSQSVSVGTFDPIATGTIGTVSVRLKMTDATAVNGYFLSKGDDVTAQSWGIMISPNGTNAGRVALFFCATGAGSLSGYMTDYNFPIDGNFHHVVVIVGANAANTKIYIDNVSQSLTLYNTPPSNLTSNPTLPFNIAKTSRASPYTYFFKGDIDDMQIFNYALSPAEVSRLYYGPSISLRMKASSSMGGVGSLTVNGTIQ